MSNTNETLHYLPKENRYEHMIYRRCGNSGLKLPIISLGLWHNFGGYFTFSNSRQMIHKAFDLGITHFDLANNYGPPPGSAEENFGRIIKQDFRKFRDELIISTKAGYYMWPGPYGEWGSKKYLVSSIDQSLTRMGLDYVDIFYSHRFDPETPLEETMSALDQIVKQGKALYAGISSYGPKNSIKAINLLSELGTPCLIHQSSYSMLNRWVEADLLDILGNAGVGLIAFSPLAQGMLTDKYINGIPDGSRAQKDSSLDKNLLSDENLRYIRALNQIAKKRNQTLAQMALAWVLRDERVVSVLVGASHAKQVEENVMAMNCLDFSTQELENIDNHAREGGINLWAQSSEHG